MLCLSGQGARLAMPPVLTQLGCVCSPATGRPDLFFLPPCP